MYKPYFFLHIPKTAGTTLNHIFEDNFSAEKILSVYSRLENEAFKVMEDEKLKSYQLVQGHIFINNFEKLFAGPLGGKVFTFVREPLARVISEYEFLSTWPHNHLYQYMQEQKIGFREFITSKDPRLVNHGKNLMTRSLCGVGLEGLKEMQLRAQDHLSRLWFLGITERFDESLLLLQEKMELQNIYYEKRNVRKFKQKYKDEDLEVALEYNQTDLELYRYACDLFEQQVRNAGPGFQRKLGIFSKLNEKFQKISKILMRREGYLEDGIISYAKD